MVRRLPPLNALRAFEAAARHGSFAKAADELAVTPTAVSHQVRQLEELLGATLFDRLPRGLRLTDAGRAVAPDLTRGLDHMARAVGRLAETRPAGVLRVSALPSLATMWLARRLPEFQRRHPDIDLDLVMDRNPSRFDRGEDAQGDIHVGVRYGRGEYPGLAVRRLMGETVFPVCAPTLVHGPRPLRAPADLGHHILMHDSTVLPTEQWLQWRPWLQWLGLPEVDATRGPRFTDTHVQITAAVHGMGVMLGRSALVFDHLADGRLVRPFAVTRPADFTYFAVTPEAHRNNPMVQAFVDWLDEEAAGFEARLDPTLNGGGSAPAPEESPDAP
ncbi:transcriptional regulator GcvA [Roseospira marina]|uniref:Transcriptional regulator GcvA n=1 Tax=Roseospira marina TaxID=140057 RepID=A0A5M6IAN2_9PROT|nr:transcriptional regulator GcvA [Roseospira marina]KAA5605331.1 transcriptional regulator GcvA [Roseospira marina]MBB4314802.1 LysR family glycine cleavage system transcriptional activator [Roseospira marina]MBB5087791.1 LysR family glycine cleavage system transcriptional activator [Roseospira marina]